MLRSPKNVWNTQYWKYCDREKWKMRGAKIPKQKWEMRGFSSRIYTNVDSKLRLWHVDLAEGTIHRRLTRQPLQWHFIFCNKSSWSRKLLATYKSIQMGKRRKINLRCFFSSRRRAIIPYAQHVAGSDNNNLSEVVSRLPQSYLACIHMYPRLRSQPDSRLRNGDRIMQQMASALG